MKQHHYLPPENWTAGIPHSTLMTTKEQNYFEEQTQLECTSDNLRKFLFESINTLIKPQLLHLFCETIRNLAGQEEEEETDAESEYDVGTPESEAEDGSISNETNSQTEETSSDVSYITTDSEYFGSDDTTYVASDIS
jgi:hypothetical protein